MKTAIYTEDGKTQLVLTPESDFEKEALSRFRDDPIKAKIFAGSFYDCRGGWVKQNDFYPQGVGFNDESLIVMVEEEVVWCTETSQGDSKGTNQ